MDCRIKSGNDEKRNCPSSRCALQIKIDRHALPRGALGRADIAWRGEQNILPRLPLHTVRYAIERDRFGEARIGIAAAAMVSLAWFMVAAPPQREGIAIAPLLARLLGSKPRRIFRRRQFRPHSYCAHASSVCLVVTQSDFILAMRLSIRAMAKPLFDLVTTALDAVVHAATPLTNAGGSAAKASLLHGLPGQARQ
jgi:hypothetical protein